MDCEKELGCSEVELRTRLSRYLDGELAGAEASALEEHLKSCERCRGELAGLRGADRAFAKAVESGGAGTGFVARVMTAILGRAGPAGEGRPAARPLLWLVAAVAAVGAGSLVTLGMRAALRRGEVERRALGLRIAREPPEGGSVAEWRVRRPGRAESQAAPPGASLAAGTELELPAGGAHGLVERADGLALYVEAGSVLRLAPDADDERGLALVSGRVLVDAPALDRPFELALGGAGTVGFRERGSRVHVESLERSYQATVLSGCATVRAMFAERPLGQLECISVGTAGLAGPPTRADPRALEVGFVPVRLRPSVWPMEGGSALREGRSPFAASLPPAPCATIDGASGVSATVLAQDGTAFFLAGPAPGRLVGGRGYAGTVSASLWSAFVGDPAVGPDGRIYVSTREAGLVAFRPDDPSRGFEQVVPPEEGDAPRTGPAISPDGSVALVTSRGVSLHAPDGSLRWRAQGVAASSSPAIGPDGRVYVAALSGRLHVFDAASGRDLAAEVSPVDEAFLARPCVAPDGTAWAASARRYLVRLSPDLSASRVALPEADYASSPALGPEGAVYVVSSAGSVRVFAAGATTPGPGTILYEAGEAIVQGPLVDGAGVLLLWTASGKLVSVEPTGRARMHNIGAKAPAPAAIGRDGAVIFATRDGRVFGKP